MTRPLLQTIAGVTGLLLCVPACTTEPEIVAAPPSTASVQTAADVPTDPPPIEEPSQPDTPEPTTEPVLQDSAAIDIASAFVDALVAGHERDDLSAAAEMWSGYPSLESARLSNLATLLAVHPWLLEGDLSFEAFESWAFEPQWTMKIVVITSADGTGIGTLLLDRTGVIQRIDRWVMNEPRLPVVGTDTVMYYGIPVEGYALAYLDGVLLGEPTIDHDALTTTFDLPPSTGQRELLVASFATPEFPLARADIITRP